MYKIIYLAVITLFFWSTSCNNVQKSKPDETLSYTQNTEVREGIEVIQFHSEHRCQTCVKIEEDIKASLAAFENIPFRLINVDDESHKEMSKKFEAAGTAIFLYDPATEEMVELTDFAFMNAFDSEKFKSGFQNALYQF